jgi:phenylacetate-coenzyme A ligase PaaK-like adenylate-forming protein
MDGFIHGPVADPEKAIREAESLKIDTLVGVPVQVLAMARHPEAGRLADGRLKAVLLNMDHMPLAIRTALERTWGADVYDHYGMTEMGLGGGVQCRARQGYHPRDLDLLFEVIDPATGRIVEDGQPGEVVFSTLTRKTMPLIRYRTGDWGRWLVEPCSCGGRLRTLGKVTGRVRGGIPLSGSGLLTMAALDEALFPIPGLLDFQAEIQDLETGASLELTVWAAPGANRQAVLDDAARALADLPAVQSALAKPGFHLAAPVAGPESGPDRGSAKRRIIDCRRNMPDLI